MTSITGIDWEALRALGTGPVADAFYAAFQFPNTFRRLFAEGAFNTAFVPLFAKEIEEACHLPTLNHRGPEIGTCLVEVGSFQLEPDERAAGLHGLVSLAADAGERRQHQITRLAPKA